MKKEHQRHAAQCRHANANEAKSIFFQELSALFATYRLNLPLQSRLTAYASTRRRVVLNYASRFGFKESTLRTWLREWIAHAYTGC